MYYKVAFLLGLLSYYAMQVRSQVMPFYFQIDNNLLIRDSLERLLPNAWAGGLNSPQWLAIDLNHDQQQDLLIFERTNSKFYPFISQKQGNVWGYTYTPYYEGMFPVCRGWVILQDYNQDGKIDIFTHGTLGMRVWQNISPNTQKWQFSLVADPLFSQGGSGNLNLAVPITDIPVVIDIDQDQDQDIVCFDVTGTYIELHQNQSIERYGNTQRLEFIKTNTCWGGLQATTNCADYTFGLSCQLQEWLQNRDAGGGGKRVKHAGNSLLLLNLNQDNRLDLLTGHISCRNLYQMLNTNTNTQAVFQSFSTNFPPDKPVDMFVFPAAFYVDIDFDQKNDLIISPNLFANEADRVNFRQSAWLYKNIGTTDNPDFRYQKPNFLQDQMIDLGEDASVAWVDIDKDQDLDMLLTHRGIQQSSGEFYATIWLWENRGTAQKPDLYLKDQDFLQLSTYKWQSLQIQIQDFDKNNSLDIGIITTRLSPRQTQMFVIPNQASPNSPPLWDKQNLTTLALPLAFRDNPLIVDVNQDNIADLLVGKAEGNLEYYQNVGTNQHPTYVLANENFLGIAENPFQRDLVPIVADWDSNGNLDLVTADNRGILSVYPNFRQDLNKTLAPHTAIIADSLSQTFKEQKLGAKLIPCAIDYNADGRPDIMVGTNTGGVVLLQNLGRNIFANPNSKGLIRAFYPNPSPHFIRLQLNQDAQVQLYNVLGQQLYTSTELNAAQEHSIDIGNFPAGMYIMKVQSRQNNSIETQKILIQR